eukprot:TRINITY_DN58760_c0_g2_i1.p1 TRINITY_DN58760_c0_g2~~TRINITY_DN58760_c0_g2_i1.p1  ORF type:complete len:525 (+),score=127.65 TRINITY_DN58760_c0_g2_i1:46-1620(+)
MSLQPAEARPVGQPHGKPPELLPHEDDIERIEIGDAGLGALALRKENEQRTPSKASKSSGPGAARLPRIDLAKARADFPGGKCFEQYKGVGKRKSAHPDEAKTAMSHSAFFTDFQKLLPGAIDKLAALAKKQRGKKDEILFRQGDPSKDCYLILSGSVEVRVRPEPSDSPRVPPPGLSFEEQEADLKLAEQQRPRLCSLARCFRAFSGAQAEEDEEGVKQAWAEPKAEKSNGKIQNKNKVKTPEEMWLEKPDLVPYERRRYFVTEGHSSFTVNSKLGKRLATLGRNAVVGDFGVITNRPRSASVKVLEDCMFLVFPKEDITNMAQDFEVARFVARRMFFQQVPGFKEYDKLHWNPGDELSAERPLHPCEQFREENFKQGHEVLSQDVMADPVIVIVKTGEVAFRRPTGLLPKPCFTNAYDDLYHAASKMPKTWHKVYEGEVFCSLSALGIPFGTEPFTAEVWSEECNVYILRGQELELLPDQIRMDIFAHVVKSMRHLLSVSKQYFALSCTVPEGSQWRAKLHH